MNKKAVIAVIIILVIISLVLLGLTLHFALKKHDLEKHKDICITRDCALTAANLIKAMKPELDPCKDFNQFACADFIRQHPVPEHETDVSTWTLFNSYFNLQLKDAIETLNPDNEPYIVRQYQEGYHVCLNISYQPVAELAALKKLSQDVYNWPLLAGSNWRKRHNSFTKYIENIEKLGMPNGLFTLQIGHNPYDESKYAATIDTNHLKVFPDKDDELDIKMQKAEYELIQNLMKQFGNEDTGHIDLDLKKMKDASNWIESKLAETSAEEEEDEEMTIKELNELCRNKINWVPILNARMPKQIYTFTETDLVAPTDRKNLQVLLDLMDEYDSRVIYNLIAWKTIKNGDLIDTAGAIGAQLIKTYYSTNPDYEPRPVSTADRGLQCAQIYQQTLPMVTTRIFVNKYIDKNDKANADEMIRHIQAAYKNLIEKSLWLDEATKKKAVIKAETIRRHVAYPDFIFDDQKLNAFHADVPPVESTEFLNNLNRKSYLTRRKLIESTYTIDDDLWTDDPLEQNAFYASTQNAIWFPTAILQLPFFDSTRLAAINFGGIGGIIGHEIGHAFDDSGSQYDENGKKVNWWSNKTGTIYREKTKCFIKQFDEFCPEELKGDESEKFCVSGENTLGENMADFTGLQAAFDAYKLWVKKHGKEPRLPGLSQFSPEQLFFISYAFTWCETVPPDKWSVRFSDDPHAPGEYRILGPLSNSEDFRREFNCSVGKMNRGKDSCTIW